MATLVRKDNSPFWIVQYRSPKTGKWTQRSTKCRIGIGTELRRARKICAELTKRESDNKPADAHGAWDDWMPLFIAERYSQSPLSRIRYEAAWDALRVFLVARGILHPAQLTYQDCLDYLEWRTVTPLKKKKPASRNSAILELKFLGIAMKEAIRRKFTSSNPCSALGIKREKHQPKGELTDDEIARIRSALTKPWMQRAFEIAIHHGVRLSETDVWMDDVDLETGLVHFRKTKGDKPFTASLHPNLRPMFAELKARGAVRACDLPPNPAKPFHKLFRKLGIEKSFHSTRVSVASRLARAGEPMAKAMAYINHSSELIHRAYQRWRPQDLTSCHAALHIPLNETQDVSSAKPEHEKE